MRHETALPVHVVDTPLLTVALGAGRSLDEFETMERMAVLASPDRPAEPILPRLMTARAGLAAVLLALALAGCSGETKTVTVAGPTVTETKTDTVSRRSRATTASPTMAERCAASRAAGADFGGLETAEEIADELAEDVAPELRAAARRGCWLGSPRARSP